MKTQILITLVLFALIQGCKNTSGSNAIANDPFETQTAPIDPRLQNLPPECQDDVNRLANYLSYVKQHLENVRINAFLTADDEQEWFYQSRDISREFESSESRYSQSTCAQIVYELKRDFSTTMIEIARLRAEPR